ncbi:MAG: IS110 family transposase [Chloroflexota bacterium]|nr:IS110 family transposase [Chloroflexota bacterium]
MHSMTQEQDPVVIGGVDAHANTHHAAALDGRGALLGIRQFAATSAGYEQLWEWLSGFGRVEAVAVESSSSYAAGLTRALLAHGIEVAEVNQPHAHTRRRRGKSDAIDAETAARRYLTGEGIAIPKHTSGIVESIRMLRVARQGAVKARTAAQLQARDLITTAPQQLREQILVRKTLRARLAICARFRPADASTPEHAAKFALKVIAERVSALDREIAVLDAQLEQLVSTTAPRTMSLLGISTGHAGQFLVTAGQNIDRLGKGESSFAALCGASPIKASSGKTNRHRLNPGGDRQANRALHLVAVFRLGCCPRTQAYAARRTKEGRDGKDIIRCLKRAIAREVYHALAADLTTPTPSVPYTAILCGSPGHGRSRGHT